VKKQWGRALLSLKCWENRHEKSWNFELVHLKKKKKENISAVW